MNDGNSYIINKDKNKGSNAFVSSLVTPSKPASDGEKTCDDTNGTNDMKTSSDETNQLSIPHSDIIKKKRPTAQSNSADNMKNSIISKKRGEVAVS